MDVRRVIPLDRPLQAVLEAPPSKSVTHRALIAAALAHGPSRIVGPLVADDTRSTLAGLSALGIGVEANAGCWIIEGRSGHVPGGGHLFLGESGSSLRFLAAVAALGGSPSSLDGSPRLRQRPIRELGDALSTLGAAIELTAQGGGIPLRAGGAVVRGGPVALLADRSSQFASALMLIGARLASGLDLTLEPPAVSVPYVELTTRVLEQFGVAVERLGVLRWRVRPGEYAGREYRIDGDHSSASYFLAAAAVVGGRVRVEGLSPASAQPDRRLGSVLAELGCRVRTGNEWIEVDGGGKIPAFDLDLGDAPDLAPTLAVLGLFAEGPCVLRGIAHLRHKESNRLEVLAEGLRSLGRQARAGGDRLEIGPPPAGLHGGTISTASDHRIAMAFAIAGLRVAGVTLKDPGCVDKSNPTFWEQFRQLGGLPQN